MNVDPNFRTKRDLKAAVARGYVIDVFASGLETVPKFGEVVVEGPRHRWRARVGVLDGMVVSVLS